MYLPQETPIIITGNKCDLPNRQIPLDEAERYGKTWINQELIMNIDMQLRWEVSISVQVLNQEQVLSIFSELSLKVSF